jgi:O-antigen ligase
MKLRQLYLSFFLFVYALYCYFDRGVAYTYMAEAVWLTGLLLIIKERRSFVFAWDRRMLLISLLLLITFINMLRGFFTFGVMDVIRDSFMFNYLYFIFIVFLLRKELPQLKEGLYKIYQWFPLIVASGFLLRSFVPAFAELKLFGGIPLLEYKNGDMAIHLLVTVFFIVNGNIKTGKRFQILNIILIAYLFLVTATFNRGGMLAFLTGLGFFFFSIRKTPLAKQFYGYLKFLPIIIIIALPLYLSTKVEDKVQGRNIGIGQLKDNVTSIINRDSESDLNANVMWRLVWWAKIIDYTLISREYFWQGKGLGVNLAVSDSIEMEGESLRAPHNFHLHVLARFGIPSFIIWLLFLGFLFLPPLRKKNINHAQLSMICILLAAMVNASFDVFLEGPMGGFPCWVIAGIYFTDEMSEKTYPADIDRDLGENISLSIS